MTTFAKVKPFQPWGQDGYAEVWIYGILNIHDILPLENRTTVDETTQICRSTHPKGLVRINLDNLPQPKDEFIIVPVDLPTGDCIDFHDWPHGVIWFM